MSEIHYNPTQTQDYEFVEFFNFADDAIDVSGAVITALANFTLPSGTSIAANGFLLVVADREKFAHAFGTQFDGNVTLVGDFQPSRLSNDGERIDLVDGDGGGSLLRASVKYSDALPWPLAADGFGASLQLACLQVDQYDVSDAKSWRAGELPDNASHRTEQSGASPGRHAAWQTCAQVDERERFDAVPIVFSEILYRAVGENTQHERHEFVELFNGGARAFDLSGFRLQSRSTLRFEFAAGTEIAANGTLLIVKAPRLVRYRGVATVGPFQGNLNNGREALLLVDRNGRGVERVSFDDEFPWPRVADAFGANDRELALLRPDYVQLKSELAAAQSGISLQRRSPARAARSWNFKSAPATPGQVLAFEAGELAPRVTELDVWRLNGTKKESVLLPAHEIHFRVEVRPVSSSAARALYLVYQQRDYEHMRPIGTERRVELQPVADAEGRFAVTLSETFEANAVVRYHVESDDGAVREPASDEVHLFRHFFVAPEQPVLRSKTRSFHVFINQTVMMQLQLNAEANRSDRFENGTYSCQPNAAWREQLPALVVLRNRDVRWPCFARFSGSIFGRPRGLLADNSTAWPRGSKALSFRFNLPRAVGAPAVKQKFLLLHKLFTPCAPYALQISHDFYRKTLKVPASRQAACRVFVNGQFWRQMLDLEHGNDLHAREWDEQNERCWHQTATSLPLVFKSHGDGCREDSMYGCGGMEQLPPHCGYTPSERYRAIYTLSSNTEWADHSEFEEFLLEINEMFFGGTTLTTRTPRTEFPEALKQRLREMFDVNLVLNEIAASNGIVAAYDLCRHNYFVTRGVDPDYQKWRVTPWDMDNTVGVRLGNRFANVTGMLNRGEYGDPDQFLFNCTIFRYLLVPAFRDELYQRYSYLANAVDQQMVDETVRAADDAWVRDEANESTGGWGVNTTEAWPQCIDKIDTYLTNRTRFLRQRFVDTPAYVPNFCPDKPTVVMKRVVEPARGMGSFEVPPSVSIDAASGAATVLVRWGDILPNRVSANVSFVVQKQVLSSSGGARRRQADAGEQQWIDAAVPAGATSWTDVDVQEGGSYAYRLQFDGRVSPQTSIAIEAPTSAASTTALGATSTTPNSSEPSGETELFGKLQNLFKQGLNGLNVFFILLAGGVCCCCILLTLLICCVCRRKDKDDSSWDEIDSTTYFHDSSVQMIGVERNEVSMAPIANPITSQQFLPPGVAASNTMLASESLYSSAVHQPIQQPPHPQQQQQQQFHHPPPQQQQQQQQQQFHPQPPPPRPVSSVKYGSVQSLNHQQPGFAAQQFQTFNN